jgi:hypothetical protein
VDGLVSLEDSVDQLRLELTQTVRMRLKPVRVEGGSAKPAKEGDYGTLIGRGG